jgi:FkbM family methyltransferase
MDYWPQLPPVADLPAAYRVWAWWLRHGPKRSEGTVGGSWLYALLVAAARLVTGRAHAYATLRAAGLPAITIDLRDRESFHHVIPVWYRGDCELEAVKAVLRPGDVYIDVGANYGAYALVIASLEGVRVIAVEPQPHVAEALRQSVLANCFTNFEVIQAALAAEAGTAFLTVGVGSGTASLRRERSVPNSYSVSVPLRTLDSICTDIARVACVKLDVEGGELEVLRGSKGVLTRDQPVVIFEVSRGDRSDEVFQFLRSLGYMRFYDQATTNERRLIAPRLNEVLTNVIAVPEWRAIDLESALIRRVSGGLAEAEGSSPSSVSAT